MAVKRRLRPTSQLALAAGGVGLWGLWLLGCAAPAPTPADGTGAGECQATPIVLVSIDTLRSDRLPAYGYDAGDTPAIDRLRRDAVLFERAYSPAPLTFPAHASLFTGELPPAHGVHDNAGYVLGENAATLAERLGRACYRTAAAVSSYVLRSGTGIEQGFEHYDDDLGATEGRTSADIQRDGMATVAAALEWLRESGRSRTEAPSDRPRPVFLFVHLFEPHAPYVPPEPFASRLADPYDGEIAAADRAVGVLLDGLEELGLYDDAVIVLVSDHGEGLGDHGEQEHGLLLYRESLQVPLLVKLPDRANAGAAFAGVVSLVDLAPTLLELAGLDPGDGRAGRSLVPALDGRPIADRVALAETFYPLHRFGWSPLVSAISDRHHLVEGGGRQELFDLEADPGELDDLAARDAASVAAVGAHLAGYERTPPAPHRESAETIAALEALGYVASGDAPQREGEAAWRLPHPRDRIAVLDRLARAVDALRAGEARGAAEQLRRLVSEEPSLVDGWQFLGVALDRLGDPESAYGAYSRALELSGNVETLAPALTRLAATLGRWDEVLVHARAAEAAGLEERRIGALHTQALLVLGRVEEARTSAGRNLERWPDDPELIYQAGAVEIGARALERAEQLLRRALELRPDYVPALSDLAVLLAVEGRAEEAAPLYRRVLELDPDNRQATEGLARIEGASSGGG
ncbi:MAG TPA: sulfatase-like hydrolase/transferase [Thermoanaerobaculia bacterium]|nr:sulfatase-like hydrolase/transferase [Thermoanaerobaculia bacterium]